jgi:hypothetical protein
LRKVALVRPVRQRGVWFPARIRRIETEIAGDQAGTRLKLAR